MKRMTSSNYNPCVNCIYLSSCSHIKYNDPVCPERARYDRLAAIEDILGGEYDLDRLRVIMDAEQRGGLIVGYGPGDPGEPGELGVMEEVAADKVVVVRCRDCKWFNHYTMECESDDVATDHEGGASFSINFGPDDFCSYGQRKEDEHEVS